MSEKTYTQEELIQAAAKAGAETALATFKMEKQKQIRNRRNKRLANTKLLLSNYRSFKEHSKNAIYAAEQADDIIDILDLMWDPNNRSEQIVESIKKSAVRTKIIMTHIDGMLNSYREICEKSKNPTDMRKYDALYERYISDEPRTIDEIAMKHSIDLRTAYRDIDMAVHVMAALIFGVDCIFDENQIDKRVK